MNCSPKSHHSVKATKCLWPECWCYPAWSHVFQSHGPLFALSSIQSYFIFDSFFLPLCTPSTFIKSFSPVSSRCTRRNWQHVFYKIFPKPLKHTNPIVIAGVPWAGATQLLRRGRPAHSALQNSHFQAMHPTRAMFQPDASSQFTLKYHLEHLRWSCDESALLHQWRWQTNVRYIKYIPQSSIAVRVVVLCSAGFPQILTVIEGGSVMKLVHAIVKTFLLHNNFILCTL